MNVVTTHRVYAVRLPVNYVLVIEKEFVRLHKLSLTLREFIADYSIFEDVTEFEVVVRYCLAAEHNHGVRIDHVQAHEPNLLFCHYVNYLPISSLHVELLNAGPVGECLVADSIDVSLGEGAAIRASHSLRQLRESLLPLGGQVEGLALTEVGALQRTPNYVDVILFLCNAEVDTVVHHFSEGLELPLRDIKLNDLRAGHVAGPVETFGLVTSDDQNVLFIYHHDLTLADLSVVDLE